MDPSPRGRHVGSVDRCLPLLLSCLALSACTEGIYARSGGRDVPRLVDGGARQDAAYPPLPPRETPDAGPDGLPPTQPDAGSGGDACMGVDHLGRCDGDVAQWCAGDGTLQTRDCAMYGMECGYIDDRTGYYCRARRAEMLDAGPLELPRDAGSPAPRDAGSTPRPDAGSAPPPSVGALSCRTYGETHTASGASWGTVLTDIVRHLPRSYGDTYYDSDHVTYGHETSHGIHSHIRNTMNDTGSRANGFYLPGGRACLVREPSMRKSHVAAHIPSTLRWTRYSLYITGSSAWDDTPLYVWDEWNAYVNGAEVGIDRYDAGLWTSGWRGTVDGVIEFVVYGIAVGMAAAEREPGYFAREPNFLAFLAHELERSMALFRRGQVISVMRWDEQDAYYERLRTGTEAAPMRDWVRARFGAEWTTRVMGF